MPQVMLLHSFIIFLTTIELKCTSDIKKCLFLDAICSESSTTNVTLVDASRNGGTHYLFNL